MLDFRMTMELENKKENFSLILTQEDGSQITLQNFNIINISDNISDLKIDEISIGEIDIDSRVMLGIRKSAIINYLFTNGNEENEEYFEKNYKDEYQEYLKHKTKLKKKSDVEISTEIGIPTRTLQEWKKKDKNNWRKKIYNKLKKGEL